MTDSHSYPGTAGAYCARKSHITSDWHVEREYDCINDLRCWFIVATVYEPDASEIGYTDGAIGSAEQRAKDIAKALNSTLAVAQAPPDLTEEMVSAGWDETRKHGWSISGHQVRSILKAALSSVTSTNCTCGGSPDQPQSHHDISCPLSLPATQRDGAAE